MTDIETVRHHFQILRDLQTIGRSSGAGTPSATCRDGDVKDDSMAMVIIVVITFIKTISIMVIMVFVINSL